MRAVLGVLSFLWAVSLVCGLRAPKLNSVGRRTAGALFSSKKQQLMSTPTFSASDINSQQQGRGPRRKMGPPQRKLSADQVELDQTTGRVAVYCVGAEIDLVALRAHVFRRGFGAAGSSTAQSQAQAQAQMLLARGGARGGVDSEEDEVCHVTNAPLYVSPSMLQRPELAASNTAGSEVTDAEWVDSNNGKVAAAATADLVKSESSLQDSALEAETRLKEQLLMATQDIFYFDYGCVVFWGLSPMEERAALTELAEFTTTPVSPEELDNSFDTLEFVFDRKANPQRPIRFDRMRLRSLQVEEKLALSYAMAQSSKLFVFESKIFQSLEKTRYLPKELAQKGRINSSKRDLNKIIGQLFVEQTEVNLFSSILDTPDFLWDSDEHVPAYQYLRQYLEVDDRVSLLNNRLGVIRELLDVLTAQVADNNSARLEWIVIWLISVEILIGIASSPLFAGRRVLTMLAVPTAILAYKRLPWQRVEPKWWSD